MRSVTQWVSVLAVSLGVVGCPSSRGTQGDDGSTQPSPNASILPAPIASGSEPTASRADAGRGGIPADSAGRLIVPEAGPPEPTPLREDEALARDVITAKDGTGVTLEATFKWSDLPAPAGGAETSQDGLKRGREKTALKVSIDLAPVGRMRFVFAAASFPLPANAELRAATEHYGHVLVWPDGNAYRVLRTGTLRALLAERRVDALPITAAVSQNKGKGSTLGMDTVKREVKSETGDLALELGNVPNIARSGELVCRLLLDLIAVDPASGVCSEGLTPLRAEFRWPKGGKLAFEVSAITRRPELPFGLLFFPPAGATFKPGELPPQAAGVFVTREDLTAFRSKAVVGEPPGPDAPGEGIRAVNRTDSLRYLLLDGVPIAWVAPRSEQFLIGALPGRYSVAWRDFLGTEVDPPKTVQVPVRVVAGSEPDAGAPPK